MRVNKSGRPKGGKFPMSGNSLVGYVKLYTSCPMLKVGFVFL